MCLNVSGKYCNVKRNMAELNNKQLHQRLPHTTKLDNPTSLFSYVYQSSPLRHNKKLITQTVLLLQTTRYETIKGRNKLSLLSLPHQMVSIPLESDTQHTIVKIGSIKSTLKTYCTGVLYNFYS